MNDALDPTRRFSARVADYVRHRPSYPEALLDCLERHAGLCSDTVVADIGSGTGISSEPFLSRGCTVFAVEPNDDMRRAAESRFGELPRFRSVRGRAEQTTLPDDSIDLAVAGQAFHWFDPSPARKELRRILRPRGKLAVFWNGRRTDTSFNREYEQLVERFATDDRDSSCRMGEAHDLKSFFEDVPLRFEFPNSQTFDRDGLRGRLLSSSYAPLPGHPDHARMLDALDALFEQQQRDGHVRFEYETALYLGCA